MHGLPFSEFRFMTSALADSPLEEVSRGAVRIVRIESRIPQATPTRRIPHYKGHGGHSTRRNLHYTRAHARTAPRARGCNVL